MPVHPEIVVGKGRCGYIQIRDSRRVDVDEISLCDCIVHDGDGKVAAYEDDIPDESPQTLEMRVFYHSALAVTIWNIESIRTLSKYSAITRFIEKNEHRGPPWRGLG